jgi:hypothetical protein
MKGELIAFKHSFNIVLPEGKQQCFHLEIINTKHKQLTQFAPATRWT